MPSLVPRRAPARAVLFRRMLRCAVDTAVTYQVGTYLLWRGISVAFGRAREGWMGPLDLAACLWLSVFVVPSVLGFLVASVFWRKEPGPVADALIPSGLAVVVWAWPVWTFVRTVYPVVGGGVVVLVAATGVAIRIVLWRVLSASGIVGAH